MVEFGSISIMVHSVTSSGEMIEMMKRLKLEEARRTEEEANAMLQRELEEVAGEEYLMKFSKQCPGCAYRIQVSGIGSLAQ